MKSYDHRVITLANYLQVNPRVIDKLKNNTYLVGSIKYLVLSENEASAFGGKSRYTQDNKIKHGDYYIFETN